MGDLLADAASTQAGRGAKYSYTIHLIEDATKLKKTLQLSLGASFGTASGGAQFANEMEVNASSICLIAQMTVEFAAKTVVSNRASQDILRQLKNMTISQIYQEIGDQFVDSLTLGGSIYVVPRIQAVDESDKERLAVQLKGSHGAFAAQADFQSSIEKATNHRDTEITITGEGGVIKAVANLKDAMEAIQGLAALTIKQAYPISFHVSPSTIMLAGTDLSADEVPRLGRSFDWLQKASEIYDQLVYRRSTWRQFKKASSSGYNVPDLGGLSTSAIAVIDERCDNLKSAIANVRRSPYPALPDLSIYWLT